MNKWTVQKIEGYVDRILNKQGLTREFPVLINGRLTRTLGRVTTRAAVPVKMEFSRQFLETSSDNSIIEVILHESAHAIVALETKQNHGHDQVFKDVCARIGCSADEPQTEVERIVDVKSKYEVWCDDCNALISEFSRACKTTNAVKAGHCNCGRCRGANLRLVQNW